MAAGWIALGTSVVKGVRGRRSGKKQEEEALDAEREAKADAERIAQANAALIRRESEEQFRRMDREQEFRMGSARATALTSGAFLEGSPQRALREIETEFSKQREYAGDIAFQRERMALEGAEGAGSQYGDLASQIKYQTQSQTRGHFLDAVSSGAGEWWS